MCCLAGCSSSSAPTGTGSGPGGSDGGTCADGSAPPCPRVIRKVLMIRAKLPTTQSVRGTSAVAPPMNQHEYASASATKTIASNAPIVLVRNCADIALEAVTDPPNQPDVTWAVAPNPGGAGTPALTPAGTKAT